MYNTDYLSGYLKYLNKNLIGGNDENETDFPCVICTMEISYPMIFKNSKGVCFEHVFCIECLYEYLRLSNSLTVKCPLDRNEYIMHNLSPENIFDIIETNKIFLENLGPDEIIECKNCTALKLQNNKYKRKDLYNHWKQIHLGNDDHLLSKIQEIETPTQNENVGLEMLSPEMLEERFIRQQEFELRQLAEERRMLEEARRIRENQERINHEIEQIFYKYRDNYESNFNTIINEIKEIDGMDQPQLENLFRDNDLLNNLVISEINRIKLLYRERIDLNLNKELIDEYFDKLKNIPENMVNNIKNDIIEKFVRNEIEKLSIFYETEFNKNLDENTVEEYVKKLKNIPYISENIIEEEKSNIDKKVYFFAIKKVNEIEEKYKNYIINETNLKLIDDSLKQIYGIMMPPIKNYYYIFNTNSIYKNTILGFIEKYKTQKENYFLDLFKDDIYDSHKINNVIKTINNFMKSDNYNIIKQIIQDNNYNLKTFVDNFIAKIKTMYIEHHIKNILLSFNDEINNNLDEQLIVKIMDQIKNIKFIIKNQVELQKNLLNNMLFSNAEKKAKYIIETYKNIPLNEEIIENIDNLLKQIPGIFVPQIYYNSIIQSNYYRILQYFGNIYKQQKEKYFLQLFNDDIYDSQKINNIINQIDEFKYNKEYINIKNIFSTIHNFDNFIPNTQNKIIELYTNYHIENLKNEYNTIIINKKNLEQILNELILKTNNLTINKDAIYTSLKHFIYDKVKTSIYKIMEKYRNTILNTPIINKIMKELRAAGGTDIEINKLYGVLKAKQISQSKNIVKTVRELYDSYKKLNYTNNNALEYLHKISKIKGINDIDQIYKDYTENYTEKIRKEYIHNITNKIKKKYEYLTINYNLFLEITNTIKNIKHIKINEIDSLSKLFEQKYLQTLTGIFENIRKSNNINLSNNIINNINFLKEKALETKLFLDENRLLYCLHIYLQKYIINKFNNKNNFESFLEDIIEIYKYVNREVKKKFLHELKYYKFDEIVMEIKQYLINYFFILIKKIHTTKSKFNNKTYKNKENLISELDNIEKETNHLFNFLPYFIDDQTRLNKYANIFLYIRKLKKIINTDTISLVRNSVFKISQSSLEYILNDQTNFLNYIRNIQEQEIINNNNIQNQIKEKLKIYGSSKSKKKHRKSNKKHLIDIVQNLKEKTNPELIELLNNYGIYSQIPENKNDSKFIDLLFTLAKKIQISENKSKNFLLSKSNENYYMIKQLKRQINENNLFLEQLLHF